MANTTTEHLTLVVTHSPDHYDSNDIYWLKDGKPAGSGFQSKDDKRNHVVRCPMCNTENYSMRISEGSCYSCNYDPNEEIKKA